MLLTTGINRGNIGDIKTHGRFNASDIRHFFIPNFWGIRTQNILNMRQSTCEALIASPVFAYIKRLLKLTGDYIMSNIFSYKQKQIRTTLINNQPYFCLSDCCKALEIHNSKTSVKLSEDGVGKAYLTDNLGRNQEATFINEPNLYRLIFRSNKPEAQKFANWVYEEVLPQIRKTGEYRPDFEKTLTVVKQHSRKLPTVRVKKEITLSQKQMGAIGAMIKNCVACEIAKSEQRLMQPDLFSTGTNKLENLIKEAQGDKQQMLKTNHREMIEATNSVRKFGLACYDLGTLDAVINLMKQGKLKEM